MTVQNFIPPQLFLGNNRIDGFWGSLESDNNILKYSPLQIPSLDVRYSGWNRVHHIRFEHILWTSLGLWTYRIDLKGN